MNVVTTGMTARSASACSSFDACPRMTPLPARMSGRSARLMASAARASDGRSYRLSELLADGPVVLIFYPGNNTPG
jgi:hypothetical protein